MCTLAWGREKGHLWACFNRDEQRSRADAGLPEMMGEPGDRLVFARDPVGMGSWFVASERGYTIALLNHYPAGAEGDTAYPRSRGQLVLEAARGFVSGEIGNVLHKEHLLDYAPFHLFILEGKGELCCTWDGSELVKFTCPRRFFTTSSFMQETVVPWREQWWGKSTADRDMTDDLAGEILRRFNLEQPAWGTTMDRKDARTVSQIQLRMGGRSLAFIYRRREPEGIGFFPPEKVTCPATGAEID